MWWPAYDTQILSDGSFRQSMPVPSILTGLPQVFAMIARLAQPRQITVREIAPKIDLPLGEALVRRK